MTHRILSPLKSLTAFAAFRLVTRKAKPFAVTKPEPILSTIEPETASDDWMFAAGEISVSPYAHALSGEMARVSGALSGLRSLLTQISHHAPVLDVAPVGLPFGPLAGDAMLFDGEAMAASYGPAPNEDADLFDDVAFLSRTESDAEPLARVA